MALFARKDGLCVRTSAGVPFPVRRQKVFKVRALEAPAQCHGAGVAIRDAVGVDPNVDGPVALVLVAVVLEGDETLLPVIRRHAPSHPRPIGRVVQDDPARAETRTSVIFIGAGAAPSTARRSAPYCGGLRP